jgi:hypothetical protein
MSIGNRRIFGLFGVLFISFGMYCAPARAQLVQLPEGTPTRIETRELSYTFWGLRPSPIVLSAADLCPEGGIASIYEYSSLKDFWVENLSLGIFSPKHLEVECYEIPKTKKVKK